jgi:F-type H+-transporting ATPase subunit delta
MSVFAARYAKAFLDVVTDTGLETSAVDRQLNDFMATWDGSPELQAFFMNPAIPAKQKVTILDQLNAKLGLQKPLRNLVAVLIDHGRIGHVKEVIDSYRKQLQERMGIRPAEIVTARELSREERDTLIAGIAKLAESDLIEPVFKLDKSILGGTVVRIGSTVYDGSVRGRLERLKEQLVGDQ